MSNQKAVRKQSDSIRKIGITAGQSNQTLSDCRAIRKPIRNQSETPKKSDCSIDKRRSVPIRAIRKIPKLSDCPSNQKTPAPLYIGAGG